MHYGTPLVSVLCVLIAWTASETNICREGFHGERCLLQCRCKNSTKCDDVTGECTSGCSPGWDGVGCQRQNLAYNKNTTMRLSEDDTPSPDVTDGDVTTCQHTRPNRTGWLKVDLGATHTVHSMKLYTGEVTSRDWKVYVSDYEELFWFAPCTVVRYDVTEAEFTCDEPVEGRWVGIMNKGAPLTVCEFQIFACADFTFGDECSSRCRCFNQSEMCDPVYGKCISRCPDGWTGSDCHTACNMTYGRNCVHRCGQCVEGEQCQVDSGTCLGGCAPGWMGSTCHTECPEGSHGPECTETCGHCVEGSVCSTRDGRCPRGCKVGWKGAACNKPCDVGEFGADCAQKCGHCKSGTGCDHHSGMCTSGCDPGWEGIFCNQECLPGRYGQECSKTCGKCRTPPCAPNNGSCGVNGCVQGWSGDACIFACLPGFYGSNCNLPCGHCMKNKICDPLDGTCGTTCQPGYLGDKCIQKCPGGRWGDNCTQSCGLCYRNEDCNPVTGFCDLGCFEGHSGTYCTIEDQFMDLSSALVAPVMAVSVAIVAFNLCLLFVCLVVKWRRDVADIPHAELDNKEALL